jgi:hypothetical protein
MAVKPTIGRPKSSMTSSDFPTVRLTTISTGVKVGRRFTISRQITDIPEGPSRANSDWCGTEEMADQGHLIRHQLFSPG